MILNTLAALMFGVLAQAAQPKDAEPPKPPAPTIPSDLDRRLDALDKKLAEVKDLSADFVQLKKTPLLKKPLTSSGTVKVRGSKTRWDTAKPHPTVMTIDPAELRLYYPDQKTVEVYPIDGQMSKMAASPVPRVSVIREQFTVSEVKGEEIDPTAKEGVIGLKLLPIQGSLKEHIRQVRVLVDASTGVGRIVEVTDAEGETTTITFTSIKTNTGMKESDVDLKTPAGTTVSRPLQGEKPKDEGSK